MTPVSQYFGLLIESEKVVAVGPMEQVSYGPALDDFYVITLDGDNAVVLHQGSASLGFISVPIPSVN